MLKLKSLELSGFKSFADKTQVLFTDGVTAVIGPNGCGKSNLSDAIGWVLGAQTAKNLRGQKMEDFIFGGTRKRKASGMAEVTLTLASDSDTPLSVGGVTLDPGDVSVTRKHYRSGESVYLINNRRFRLMDIHEFLERGGLGFASYAMIAQGRIDSFLTAKPMDRRVLIEEAAQISGYRAKRRNAELKLEVAQQNLLRVSDIIAEVERQMRSLKRQAGKTKVYRKLKEEYRRVSRVRFKLAYDQLTAERVAVESRLAELKAKEETLLERVSSAEAEFSAKAARRDQAEAELAAQKELRGKGELELDRARNSLRFDRQQLEQASRSLAAFSFERKGLLETLSKAGEEEAQLQEESLRLSEEEQQASAALILEQGRVRDCSIRLNGSESRLDELRNRLMAVAAESASLRNLSEQLQQRIQRIEADARKLGAEREAARQRLAHSRATADERKANLQAKSSELKELQLTAQYQKLQAGKLAEEFKELEQRENQLKNQLVALNERLQSLQELELSRSNLSEGVQKVLHHLGKSGSIATAGTLADSIETEPQFEKMVEEFLEKELEYILVDSLDEAVRGVSEVRTLKSAKCTFLSLYSTNGFGKNSRRADFQGLPGRSDGVFGRLSDVVHMKPEVEEAFVRVLPQHADSIVVSDMDRAMHLAHSYPESTMITLSGEALTPRGLVKASALGSGKLGILGLKRQRRDLERKVEAQQGLLHQAVQAKESKQGEAREAARQFETSQAGIFELEKTCLSLRHQLEQAEQEWSRQERFLQNLETEASRMEFETSEMRARLEGIQVTVGGNDQLREELDAQLKEGKEAQAALRCELEALQQKANSLLSQRRVLEERKSAVSGTLARIRQQKGESERRLAGLGEREEAAREQIRALEEAIARLGTTISKLEAELKEGALQLEELQRQVTVVRQDLHNMETGLQLLRREKDQAREVRGHVEVEIARVEAQTQALEDQCREQLRLALDEALAGVEVGDAGAEALAGRYERLKRRLDTFGPINMTALQDYHECQERYAFLTGQKADIEKSIKDTTEAIQEINRRSKVRFAEAFDTVNRNFKEVFQKLFGGGECGMTLIDEEDVLESGIDLHAQPPGKKLQNVMLLSGGEKTLTVFALLVGIFMYRRSRFCVLDEVDAPLDDANVRRFAALVQEMSADTQFIVVTHNKRTMESANAIYGITMEEPGVSRVVSARF